MFLGLNEKNIYEAMQHRNKRWKHLQKMTVE